MRKKAISLFVAVISAFAVTISASAVDYKLTVSDGNDHDLILTNSAEYPDKFIINDDPAVYDNLGDIVVTDGTLSITFNTSHPVFLNGSIKVIRGKVEMLLGNNYTSDVTLKRMKNYAKELIVTSNESDDVQDCQLAILGKESKPFVIDGYGAFSITGSNAGWNAAINTGEYNGSTTSLMSLIGGMTDLKLVNLQNNWNKTNNGGAITVSSVADLSQTELNMVKCTIDHCYSYKSGSAIYFKTALSNGKVSAIEMKECVTSNCYSNANGNSDGGTYRTENDSYCSLKMRDCIIKSNYSKKYAGAIYWNAGRVRPLELENCTVKENWSNGPGGGLYLGSLASLKSVKINNNYGKYGGGIYYSTFESPTEIPDFALADSYLNLDSKTEITGNTATDSGGGIYFLVKPINIYTSSNSKHWTVYNNNSGSQYKTGIVINGAQISKNKSAKKGSGIYFERNTNIYITELIGISGVISDNESTVKNVESNLGGGIYVLSQNNATKYGTNPYETTTIDVSLGQESGILNISGNKTALGGGIYLDGKDIIAQIFQGVTIGAEGQSNEATGNGAGVYVKGSTLTLKGGVVGFNKAVKNGSGTGNGGGIFVTGGGNFQLLSGKVQENNATVNGGGIYVEGTSSLSVDGGFISTNKAESGAGVMLFTTGKFHMSGGTIAYNEASGTNGGGGGIYATNTGAIEFTGGNVEANKALYGHGGGLYVNNKASITVENTNITKNEALNGGGIALRTGAYMDFTSGRITGNKAISQNNIKTGYYTPSGSSGLGGGVFIAKGSSGSVRSSFSMSAGGNNRSSIFENMASNGGDDLFSDGSNTKISLPNPQTNPTKNGFEFDGWYEDYVNGDTGYGNGTKMIPGTVSSDRIIRYLKAVELGRPFYNASEKFVSGCTTYACLRMGYRPVDIVISMKGLKVGESATFNLIDEATGRRRYHVILTGKDGTSEVSQNIRYIPSSPLLTVTRSSWSWAYKSQDGTESSYTKDISDTANRMFVFDNQSKENTPLHSEAVVVNKFIDFDTVIKIDVTRRKDNLSGDIGF